MRGREGLSTNDFIHFLARDPEFRSKAESLMSGTSGRQRVNLEALAAYEIPLPSLDIQEEIAAILNPLDQKIELNRQIARSLEELAQRLFKSWFVDFDPVRAKMAGRQPAHTPPEIADLFPDRLVDSPLGPIPAGWSIEYLSNITSINSESYTAKLLPPSIDYVDISSVGQGWCEGVTRLTKDEAPSRAKRVAKPGDTIWSMVRPNRRAHFYFDAQFSASTVISTGFAVIRPQLAPTFTYFLTDQEEFSRYLERRATGAAYPAVNGKVISEFEFVWPGQQLAVAFDRIAASIKERQASLRLENQTLEELRDRLLPKLISGEIRVPEAQEMAEESAS
jgi:type I restriction enzyme S subunit